MAAWPAGPEVAAGTLSHGDDGAAEIDLPGVAAGAYRLLYAFEAVIIRGLGSLWGTLAGGVIR